MSVVNGQVANQTTFNAAFMSRIAVSTSTLAIVQLLNTDIASGPTVLNVQALLNKLIEGVGTSGIGDTNINNYANNNYIVDGDSRKVAIEKLDAQLFTTQTDLDTAEATILNHEGRITNLESNTMTIGGNKTFSGNVVVNGNFTVQGTTTYINSTDLQIVDKAILVNKDGDDTTADMGAGIEVKRTSDNGAIHFDSTKASKWKVGVLSAMYEVLVSGIAQTIAGAKTFTSAISMSSQKITDLANGTAPADAVNKSQLDTVSGVAATAVQTASNVGATGAEVFKQKTGTNLEFRKVKAGTGITIVQNADDVEVNSTATGGGARNFVTNGDAEESATSPFVPYKDAVQSRPEDGTGGAPSVTTSTTIVNPLDRTRSILLTKPAGNLQGEGWAAPFTIDLAQRAKVLKIKKSYIVNSGTFVAGQNFGTPSDSDVIIYVYDITNNRLIEPSSIRLLSNSATLSDVFESTFQTSPDSSQYRLIAHIATTTAAAFELKVEVSVTENAAVYGAPIADEQPYLSPASQGLGTLTGVELFQTRVGDKLKLRGRITLGTTTAVQARLNLPSGLSIKAGINNSNVGTFGRGGTGPQANKGGFILGGGGNNYITFSTSDVIGSTSADPTANAVGTAVGNSGETLFIECEVPIQGWSSSVQLSDDAANRLLSLKTSKNGAQSIPTSVETFITNWTINKDAGFNFNATTGEATVLSSGDYIIFGHLAFVSNGSGLRYSRIYIDGVGSEYGSTGGTPVVGGDTMTTFISILSLVAGQKIRIAGFQSSGGALNIDPAPTYFNVFKLSGGHSIAANEKVQFSVGHTSGQAIAAGVHTKVICNVKRYDSHNIYDTTTGTFRLPRAGVAQLKARFLTANLAVGTTAYYAEVRILKNGAVYKVISGRFNVGGGTTTYVYGEGACDIEGLTTDVWEVQVYHPLASNIFSGDNTQNFIDLVMA